MREAISAIHLLLVMPKKNPFSHCHKTTTHTNLFLCLKPMHNDSMCVWRESQRKKNEKKTTLFFIFSCRIRCKSKVMQDNNGKTVQPFWPLMESHIDFGIQRTKQQKNTMVSFATFSRFNEDSQLGWNKDNNPPATSGNTTCRLHETHFVPFVSIIAAQSDNASILSTLTSTQVLQVPVHVCREPSKRISWVCPWVKPW